MPDQRRFEPIPGAVTELDYLQDMTTMDRVSAAEPQRPQPLAGHIVYKPAPRFRAVGGLYLNEGESFVIVTVEDADRTALFAWLVDNLPASFAADVMAEPPTAPTLPDGQASPL